MRATACLLVARSSFLKKEAKNFWSIWLRPGRIARGEIREFFVYFFKKDTVLRPGRIFLLSANGRIQKTLDLAGTVFNSSGILYRRIWGLLS
jgi:hypothetical protein